MDPEIPNDLNDLESALRGLRPKCELPNRDRLMFEAGRKAGRPNRFWPATSGVLAASLVVSLFTRSPMPHEPMYAVATTTKIDGDSASYLRIRNAVLRDGPDALPAITYPVSQPGSEPTPLNIRSREEV